MNAQFAGIEFVGFDEGDAFSLHGFLSHQPCADSDLRVLIDAKFSRDSAAEMLEHVAHKLRAGDSDVHLDDVHAMLSRIGGAHG